MDGQKLAGLAKVMMAETLGRWGKMLVAGHNKADAATVKPALVAPARHTCMMA